MRKLLLLVLISGFGLTVLDASLRPLIAKPMTDCRAELRKCNKGLHWASQAWDDCNTQFYVCRAANERASPFQGCDGESCRKGLPPRPIKTTKPKPDKDDKPKPSPKSHSSAPPLWKNIGTTLPATAPGSAPASGILFGAPAKTGADYKRRPL
jgi:hypothetical protein